MEREKMRAALYVGEESFRIEDRARREPAPSEVRIDVAFVGICGTDLHIKHGAMDRRVTIPAVIGHEMSGTVAAVGDGVRDYAPGDAVTVMPLAWCGRCPACIAGHQHVCQNLVFIGIDAEGAMQQSWTVPEHLLVRLPPDLALRDGALSEPLAVAVHDVRRGAVKHGERVLVVGGGPIGLLIACVAHAEGADVLISEPNMFRRAAAADLGLVTSDPADGDLAATIESWTEGAGVDVAFEVSGSAAGMTAATHSLRVRGRLVVVAIHSQPKPVDLFRIFWRELVLIGARVYERRDFERAVELLASGQIPAEHLISRIEPLDRIAEAFTALDEGADVVKVLIDCQRQS
jgi:(R,R)-butanediol dehydrogenase / meso-butanediol dehydrogenase / diacetyl reductase